MAIAQSILLLYCSRLSSKKDPSQHTMERTRDPIHVVSSAISVGVFSIVAYCHQGTIVHRSKWNKQMFWLPVLYIMCPHLYICQIAINAVLCWDREKAMNRFHGAVHRREGFFWYCCGSLGMHTRTREWHDPPAYIANCGPETSQGMLRLHSCQTERLQRSNKFSEEDFSLTPFVFRGLWLCIQLYQVLYASITYLERVVKLPNATLGIDHLAGSYAINGALVTLASLMLHVQPFEWDDSNRQTDAARSEMADVDTSNAWIYEAFLALSLQLTVWTGLKVWRFSHTVSSITISVVST